MTDDGSNGQEELFKSHESESFQTKTPVQAEASLSAPHDIPLARIKEIIQTSTQELKPNDEGLFAMTKAAVSSVTEAAVGLHTASFFSLLSVLS